MNTIGIDFGTSFTTAAWINPKTGLPEPIKFIETGLEKIPSVVFYSKYGPEVGTLAYERIEKLNDYPKEEREEILMSIKQSIKRDMKKGQKEYLPNGKSVTHEEIIAEILKTVKKQAEEGCFGGDPITEVILTHPVDFANWQKDMLNEAARIAEFKKIKMIPEPIAAAIGYSNTGVKVGNGILVYDFGGGTFDVAFVHRENGSFTTPIPAEGDAFCGGDDIDIALYDFFEKEVFKKNGRKISEHPGRVDLQFRSVCRKAKESLSRTNYLDIHETLPPPGFVRFFTKLTRNDLEKIISPIIDKTISKTESMLNKIKSAGYEVDTVVLIGGSSRIPLIEKKLEKILPVKPLKTMNVDVAVAMGTLFIRQNPKVGFCIFCGRKLEKNDKFCIIYGKKLP